MSRNRCHGLAPSIAAASIISSGIWVSPAYRVKATNGIAHPDHDDRRHEVEGERVRQPGVAPCRRVPSWRRRTGCRRSTARSRWLVERRHRPSQHQAEHREQPHLRPSRFSSSAIAIPNTMVRATFTRQNTTVRRSTAQNSASSRIARKFVEPDPVGGCAELLLQAELLQRQGDQADDRVAEHHESSPTAGASRTYGRSSGSQPPGGPAGGRMPVCSARASTPPWSSCQPVRQPCRLPSR